MATKTTATKTADAPAVLSDAIVKTATAAAADVFGAGVRTIRGIFLDAARAVRTAAPTADRATVGDILRAALTAADPDGALYGKSTRNHYVNAATVLLFADKIDAPDADAAMGTIVNAIAKDGLTGKSQDDAVATLTRAKTATTGAATVRTNARKTKSAKTAAKSTPDAPAGGTPDLTTGNEATSTPDRLVSLTDALDNLTKRVQAVRLTDTERADLAARVSVLADAVAAAPAVKPVKRATVAA